MVTEVTIRITAKGIQPSDSCNIEETDTVVVIEK